MLKSLLTKAVNRLAPSLLWRKLSRDCRDTLGNQSYVVLSFDCDTPEDAECALDVHNRLLDIGINATYAVPGEILKQGISTYEKIRGTGAEFINHGGRSHTFFDNSNNRYASCFFYDEQSAQTLRDDIDLGHQILEKELGITPKGWRTPHFGTFQTADNLKFLHAELKRRNYIFSSSTSPAYGVSHGALSKYDETLELPVTGFWEHPLSIMDTWSCFEAPDKVKKPSDYLRSAQQLSEFMEHSPLFINIYGDPSHIAKQKEFFTAISFLLKHAKAITFEELSHKVLNK